MSSQEIDRYDCVWMTLIVTREDRQGRSLYISSFVLGVHRLRVCIEPFQFNAFSTLSPLFVSISVHCARWDEELIRKCNHEHTAKGRM